MNGLTQDELVKALKKAAKKAAKKEIKKFMSPQGYAIAKAERALDRIEGAQAAGDTATVERLSKRIPKLIAKAQRLADGTGAVRKVVGSGTQSVVDQVLKSADLGEIRKMTAASPGGVGFRPRRA